MRNDLAALNGLLRSCNCGRAFRRYAIMAYYPGCATLVRHQLYDTVADASFRRRKGRLDSSECEAASDSRKRVKEFFIRYLTDDLKAKRHFHLHPKHGRFYSTPQPLNANAVQIGSA
jgi:hypothetical protein